jgi:hypothetical protein
LPWSQKAAAARKRLATVGADSAFYFALVVSQTTAGVGGLLTEFTFVANQPFYDMFKDWGE